MTPLELIDVQAANIEVREAQRRTVSQQASDICGASSVMAFLNAVEFYQDAIAEIERKGYCLACGGVLVGESTCVRCGRDNS
jgi:formate dehydrogenase maturation protein FdhE